VYIKALNAKLNPVCHLLALLGAHHIPHVGRIRVKRVIRNDYTQKQHKLILLNVIKKCGRERRCNSTHSQPWHLMDVSGQLKRP